MTLSLLLLALGLTRVVVAAPAVVPLLRLADSINPGSADYIVEGIDRAERAHAPYLILQIDTPGGLLTSARQIIQRMLNAKIPIVVYVAPRGAHAGSAGALVTFAADVAAMAPGTNLGAAHPVAAGNEKMDAVMERKITNDTAAFAESLARAKGRNPEWAIKSVRQSAVLVSDEALKQGVVDLLADDSSQLVKKLSGYPLRRAKNGITRLTTQEVIVQPVPPGIKQRLVSFFADPNLAYLILTLGGICLWVELSHPGLFIPGIVGTLCVILSLISFQALPIHYGALALILIGMGLLLAELYLPTFGVVGLAGIGCFILGSLFLMDTSAPEFQLSLSLIFPTAAVLAAAAFVLGVLVFRSRHGKARSGIEALVGESAEVRETVGENGGKVFLHGELWNAVTSTGESIPTGSIVVVKEAHNMRLTVEAVKR